MPYILDQSFVSGMYGPMRTGAVFSVHVVLTFGITKLFWMSLFASSILRFINSAADIILIKAAARLKSRIYYYSTS